MTQDEFVKLQVGDYVIHPLKYIYKISKTNKLHYTGILVSPDNATKEIIITYPPIWTKLTDLDKVKLL